MLFVLTLKGVNENGAFVGDNTQQKLTFNLNNYL